MFGICQRHITIRSEMDFDDRSDNRKEWVTMDRLDFHGAPIAEDSSSPAIGLVIAVALSLAFWAMIAILLF